MDNILQLLSNFVGTGTSIFVAFLASFFFVQSFNNSHEHPENTTRKFYLLRALLAILAFIVAFVLMEFLISYLS